MLKMNLLDEMTKCNHTVIKFSLCFCPFYDRNNTTPVTFHMIPLSFIQTTILSHCISSFVYVINMAGIFILPNWIVVSLVAQTKQIIVQTNRKGLSQIKTSSGPR